MTRTRKARHKLPLSVARNTDQVNQTSAYNGWFDQLVHRIQAAIEAMRSTYSFEKGSEFEIAICEVLRDILPERYGVARGFVVSYDGAVAGDDIIVYDAARFPTLRHLRRDLRKKETIPAEAVLAYIEAKHTLYLHKHPTKKQHGQSLLKAIAQVAQLKTLRREVVPLATISPRFQLDIFNQRRPGYPNIRNPWYAGIWALKVVESSDESDGFPAQQLTRRLCETSPPMSPRLLPDVIAAGDLFACPTILEKQIRPSSDRDGNHKHVLPFLTRDTRFSVTSGTRSLGLAVLHLQHAIEDILLGEVPWRRLMLPDLHNAERSAPDRSAGIMFSPEEHSQLDYPLPAGVPAPSGGARPDPGLGSVDIAPSQIAASADLPRAAAEDE